MFLVLNRWSIVFYTTSQQENADCSSDSPNVFILDNGVMQEADGRTESNDLCSSGCCLRVVYPDWRPT